ncbi:MAG: hypothetical protein HQL50_09095, partial [Magnetococcales bacterium]|nr:hypothetical protein [Magnetococcales bacterium]
LVDWVYIRVLARDLSVAEQTVYRWWYSSPNVDIPSADQVMQPLIMRYMANHPEMEEKQARSRFH